MEKKKLKKFWNIIHYYLFKIIKMGRSKRNKNKKETPQFLIKQEQRLSVKAERNRIKQEKRREAKKNKILSTMEKKYLIGVYDDLREDGVDHKYIDTKDATNIGSFDSDATYSLYPLSKDSFCGLKQEGNTSVKIEVYEITETILDELDEKVYNYDPSQKDDNNLFIRKKVNSPYGEIEMWFYNDDTTGIKPLESGDWIDYLDIQFKTTPPKSSKSEFNKLLDKQEQELEDEINSQDTVTVNYKDVLDNPINPTKKDDSAWEKSNKEFEDSLVDHQAMD